MLINGHSSDGGFELQIEIENGGLYKFETCHHNSGLRNPKKIDIFLTSTIFIIAFFASIKFINYEMSAVKIAVGLLMIGINSILTAIIFGIFLRGSKSSETKEWHAIEHKCCALLANGEEISLENIKKYPKVFIHCGTSYMVLLFQVWLAFWIAILFALDIIDKNSIGTASIIIISAFVINGELSIVILCTMISGNQNWFFRWFWPILLPTVILPAAIQKFCTLKNPSDEKIMSILKDLGKFQKTLPI